MIDRLVELLRGGVEPRRSIGGLYPDVVVEENHEDSLQITEHPVEQGASVADHAFKKPVSVTVRGGVSGSVGEAREFYEQLRELQALREPFDIVTGKRLYKNMLLESLTVVTDVNTENALLFTAQCREVIIAVTQVTSVPPRKKHAQPAKTGATEDKGQKQTRQSMASAGSGRRITRPGGAAKGY